MEKLLQYETVIIGGGASGIMAAITAARTGRKVVLLEKKEKLGKKILLTGNGRCNISNKFAKEDKRQVKHYFGNNPKFVMSVFNKFGYEETKEFFENLGVKFVEEDNGRMFPAGNQAQSVVDVLEYELRELNIKLINGAGVKEIKKIGNNKFAVKISDGRVFGTSKLIIATGGKTHEQTGSTGDGYEFARQFGHKIIETFPVYSGLNITKESDSKNFPLLHILQGTKLEAAITARIGSEVIAENTGTVMFAHYGLSAPGILEISREIAREFFLNEKKAEISLNFFPGKNAREVEEMIQRIWTNSPNRTLGFSLIGVLPKKVFPAILETAGMDPSKKVAEINKELRSKIAELLTGLTFQVDSVRGFEEAHFTAGGVDTKEVNPATLESKLQPGLFFCGEVLDIDGECGGYNLQWAWSSGFVAGSIN
ncbi:NAD(P)/FAD-dependent oxidoreductase [Candidatus Dojkabacteria bacterium]|nr:NAD(P)/FAD-dependent oxidoreductase [Candidatus Dojkabacteria bacterium]